jgi:hypothetical protein
MLVDRIGRNRERNFSVGGNVAMKVVSFAGGALLCCAESNVENSYVRTGLIICTVLTALFSFFYPEYVRYGVKQVESRGAEVDCRYLSDEYDQLNHSSKQGLIGLLSRLDRCIRSLNNGNEELQQGLIIVERPKGYKEISGTNGLPPGVYLQCSYEPDWACKQIENELRRRGM